MKKKLLFGIIIGCITLGFPLNSGYSEYENSNNYVPGEILVKYKTPSDSQKGGVHISSINTLSTLEKSLDDEDFEIKSNIPNSNIAVVSTRTGMDVEDAIKILKSNPNIEYAEPNYIAYTLGINSNDTYRDELWGLDNKKGGTTVTFKDNTNTSHSYTAQNGEDIDWVKMRNTFSGSFSSSGTGKIIAVVDEGVNYNHEDLENQMRKDGNGYHGKDFIHNDYIPLPNTNDSHGTHVAGTIAAEMGNGKGIIGVNPNAKIMSLKALEGGTGSYYTIIQAINYARENNIKIINASLGGTGYSTGLYEAINAFGAAGGLFITAAGNEGKNNDGSNPNEKSYPCSFDLDNIICVAATTRNGELAFFSNYGSYSVDVGAPGIIIYSSSITGGNSPSYYEYKHGTSMAAPHVAGLASLAWSFRPDLTYTGIIKAIIENGETLSSLIPKTKYGKRINAYNTLYALDNYAPVAPELTIPTNGQSFTGQGPNFSINFEWKTTTDTGVGVSGYIFELSKNNEIISGIILNQTGLQINLNSTGNYSWKVKAFDKKGNTGDYKEIRYFSVNSENNNQPTDTTPPSVGLSNNSDSWKNEDISITLTANDEDSGLSGGKAKYFRSNSESSTLEQCRSNGTQYSSGESITYSSEGISYLYVCAYDNAGNSNISSGEYKLDKTIPSINFDKEFGDNSASHSVIVTISDGISGLSGNQILKYRRQKEENCSTSSSDYSGENLNTTPGQKSISTTITLENVSDGDYYLCILNGTINDIAGNKNEIKKSSGTFKIRNNNISPISCSISQSPTDRTNGNVTLTVIINGDNNGCEYSRTGFDNLTSTLTTYTTGENGTKTFYFRDSNGNTGTCSTNITKIDKISPNISLNNSSNSWKTEDISITLTANDEDSGLSGNKAKYLRGDSPELSLNECRTQGSDFNGGSFPITNSTEGTKYLYICAFDKAGNSQFSSGTYKLDKTDPIVNINYSSTNNCSASGVTVIINATDSISGIPNDGYSRNNKQTRGSSTQKTLNENGSGIVYVKDYAGNTTGIEYNVSRINSDTLIVTPNNVAGGECTILTGSVSVNNTCGGDISYTWEEFGTGTTIGEFAYKLMSTGTRTGNVTINSSNQSIQTKVIYTWTDTQPSLTTGNYTYPTQIKSTSETNIGNVVSLLGAKDGACGNSTEFINATYVYCTNGAGNINNNELKFIAPNNSEGSSTCSITFTDDEGNTTIGKIILNYNTKPTGGGGGGGGGSGGGGSGGGNGSNGGGELIEELKDIKNGLHENDDKKENTKEDNKQETVKVDEFQTNQNNNTTTVISNNINKDNNSRFSVGSPKDILPNGFTRELNNAYTFAYMNGITTIDNINKANMNGNLTRIEMAKMLSKYAINVLGKQPDNSKNISFGDISSSLDSQYNNGVTQAFQLGIMGIGISKFRPFDLVTRAEFVTALSRLIYGTPDGTTNYYSTHLEKLYNDGIISNTDPNMNELRGYVMLMLMRTRT